MQRVQAALKAQLTRQNEKLEIELREKVRMDHSSKSFKSEYCDYFLSWRP